MSAIAARSPPVDGSGPATSRNLREIELQLQTIWKGPKTMRILFINHHGGGFADSIDIREAITVRELFSEQMGKECSPADFLIRVNRQPTTADQVLQPGDRVSITPTKIAGATGGAGGAGGAGGR